MERYFKKTKNTRKKANDFLKTRLMERDLKSPEEDLTGEKTITASLKVSIVIYESYEKESLDGLPNVCLKSDQTFCLMQIQIRKV